MLKFVSKKLSFNGLFYNTLKRGISKLNTASSTSNSTSHSDEDLTKDKNIKIDLKKEMYLFDEEMLRSPNFLNYLKKFDEDKEELIKLEQVVEIISNIEEVENKFSTFKNIIIDGNIQFKINSFTIDKIFPGEIMKQFFPLFLDNQTTKVVSREELRTLLIWLITLKNESETKKLEYLVDNFYKDYLINFRNSKHGISFSDFKLFLRVNTYLNFSALDEFILSGLNCIFYKPLNMNSYEEFISLNDEYKSMFKTFPLFLDSAIQLRERYNPSNYLILNILNSFFNLKKVIFQDFSSVSEILKLFNKITNLSPVDLLKFQSLFYKIHLSMELNSNSDLANFIRITGHFNKFSTFKDNFDYEEVLPLMEKTNECLSKMNESNFISENDTVEFVNFYTSIIIMGLEFSKFTVNSELSEYNEKIINLMINLIKQIKRSENKLKYIMTIRKLVFLSDIKIQGEISNFNDISKDFKDFIDKQIEIRPVLLFTRNSTNLMTIEEKNTVVDCIYNKLYLIKDNDIHSFIDNLVIVYQLDNRKFVKILKTLKSEFFNSLFYAHLTGSLYYTENFNAENTLFLLYIFLPHMQMIELKDSKVENQLPKFLEESNPILQEIKSGRYNLTTYDFYNIIEGVCNLIADNEKPLKLITNKLHLLKYFTKIIFSSPLRSKLLENYYHLIYKVFRVQFNLANDFDKSQQCLEVCIYLNTLLSQVEDSKEIMRSQLKLTTIFLIKAMKFDLKSKERKLLLSLLNKFYVYYSMNRSPYDQVEKENRKHKYLQFIMRKRFILGRMESSTGPVKIHLGRSKVPAIEKVGSLNDNYFFK